MHGAMLASISNITHICMVNSEVLTVYCTGVLYTVQPRLVSLLIGSLIALSDYTLTSFCTLYTDLVATILLNISQVNTWNLFEE